MIEKIQIVLMILLSGIISWMLEWYMQTYLINTLNKRKQISTVRTISDIKVKEIAIVSLIGWLDQTARLSRTVQVITSIHWTIRVFIINKSTNVCIPNGFLLRNFLIRKTHTMCIIATEFRKSMDTLSIFSRFEKLHKQVLLWSKNDKSTLSSLISAYTQLKDCIIWYFCYCPKHCFRLIEGKPSTGVGVKISWVKQSQCSKIDSYQQ